MPVVIACPMCQQKVRIGSSLLGKQVKCPQCKNPFTAVDPNAVEAPAAAWEAVTQKPELDYDAPPPVAQPREDDFDYEEDAPPPQAPSTGGGNAFVDYLLLRRMVTPGIIIVVFYIGVVTYFIGGLVGLVSGFITLVNGVVLMGLLVMAGSVVVTILAIILWRIYCEVILVLFRILDNLRAVNEKLDMGIRTRE